MRNHTTSCLEEAATEWQCHSLCLDSVWDNFAQEGDTWSWRKRIVVTHTMTDDEEQESLTVQETFLSSLKVWFIISLTRDVFLFWQWPWCHQRQDSLLRRGLCMRQRSTKWYYNLYKNSHTLWQSLSHITALLPMIDLSHNSARESSLISYQTNKNSFIVEGVFLSSTIDWSSPPFWMSYYHIHIVVFGEWCHSYSFNLV